MKIHVKPESVLREAAGLARRRQWGFPASQHSWRCGDIAPCQTTGSSAFTMIEIAICLAIIGIALVGIIAVIPAGMHTQRDNRQETLIAQDANFLMDLVRNGSHGPDDLTNYIYAVTNYFYWNTGSGSGSGTVGYDYNGAHLTGTAPLPFNPFGALAPINSGSNIVSLLSTPEYVDAFTANTVGKPLASFVQGGVSNHIVAYVRAISGLAAEKAPQDNQIMQGDAFTYRLFAANAPMPMALPPVWTNTTYGVNATVYWQYKQWMAVTPIATSPIDEPGNEPAGVTNWIRSNPYADQLALNQRELRLRFAWPQLPNGALAANFRFINFRTTIGGALLATNDLSTGRLLYFYQPQSYTQLP